MIEIKVDDSQVKATLNRLSAKLGDLSPVMRVLSQDMLEAVRENFDQEGRPTRWTPLAESTRRYLARKGKTGKMLNRSPGGLYHSIHARSTNNAAIVGTNKRYAAIHHFGGKAGRGRKVRIPARPYLVLTDSDIQRMVAKMWRYLEP